MCLISGHPYTRVDGRAAPTLGNMLQATVDIIRRFLVLTPAQLDAIALWIGHTYIVHNADCTPYMHVLSAEKRSGKTLLLEILELLVAKPWYTGSATVAVLVRKIDSTKSTLLYDEADASFKKNREFAEALRGVLNTGFRRGGKHSCCVGQGADLTWKDFGTYGAKAFAGIGKLPDTVADRSIGIHMKRKKKAEKVERFRRRRVASDFEAIKADWQTWAEETACYDWEVPLPEELDDRGQDIWEILLQIAGEAGGEWPERARAAALGLATRTDEDDSLGVRLLADIRTVFDEQKLTRIPSTLLVEALAKIEEAPWGEMRGGRPLTANGMAKLLKPFDVHPGPHRMGLDNKTIKGYLETDFEDAWARYTLQSSYTVTRPSEPYKEGMNPVTTISDEAAPVTVQLPMGDDGATAIPSGAANSVTAVTGRGGGKQKITRMTL